MSTIFQGKEQVLGWPQPPGVPIQEAPALTCQQSSRGRPGGRGCGPPLREGPDHRWRGAHSPVPTSTSHTKQHGSDPGWLWAARNPPVRSLGEVQISPDSPPIVHRVQQTPLFVYNPVHDLLWKYQLRAKPSQGNAGTSLHSRWLSHHFALEKYHTPPGGGVRGVGMISSCLLW